MIMRWHQLEPIDIDEIDDEDKVVVMHRGDTFRALGTGRGIKDRLTAERDEAREWARKYKKKRDKLRIAFEDAENCWRRDVKQLEGALASERKLRASTNRMLGEAIEEIDELERKYKQATCEHWAINRIAFGGIHSDTCATCGKEV